MKDGLQFIQKLLRSYVYSVETLVQGKECLLKRQKVNVTKYAQDKAAYTNIQQELLHTLCLYQQFGVESDTEGIESLVIRKSCLDLNELDLEGYRLTEDKIKSVNVTITQLNKNSRSSRRSLGGRRRRNKKRGRKHRRRKNRRREKSRKGLKDVFIDVGKRLPHRRKMTDPNKT